MTDMDKARKAIGAVREAKGAGWVEVRREAEGKARTLLDAKAGSFDVADLYELFEHFRADANRNKEHRGRFEGSFAGFHADALAKDLDTVNDRLRRLWGNETEARLAADSMLRRDRLHLPMGGQSFPTMVLYVKDPSRFAIAQSVITRGCRALDVDMNYNRTKGYTSYVEYCRLVHKFVADFAAEFGLQIQEVDAVFAHEDPGPSADASSAAPKKAGHPEIAERMCGGCYTMRKVNQFVGDSNICTDCI